jgi:protein TonB
MFVSTSRRARGAAAPVVIGVIVILVLLAVAAWYLIFRPHQQAVLGQQPATPAQIAAKTAPPPANVAAMSTDQLLAEARKAMNDQRMLAPAGNNAFEFYLKVLERQPNNQVAQDALRETFPFGANAAEQAINQRDFVNAQREIDLLAKADPDNYTLTILRSKLDAQQKLMGREQQLAEQQAAKQKADDAAKAVQVAQQQAATHAAATQTAAAKAPVQAAPKPVTQQTVEAAAPAVQIQDAVPVSQPTARYPTVAKRRRQEGWVDVEFTVGTDGAVSNAHVVDANPRHVFDRSATDAVDRWQYKPALRNGQPMAVTMRRRIVFTLGGSP